MITVRRRSLAPTTAQGAERALRRCWVPLLGDSLRRFTNRPPIQTFVLPRKFTFTWFLIVFSPGGKLIPSLEVVCVFGVRLFLRFKQVVFLRKQLVCIVSCFLFIFLRFQSSLNPFYSLRRACHRIFLLLAGLIRQEELDMDTKTPEEDGLC
jgi:hypothetical protein